MHQYQLLARISVWAREWTLDSVQKEGDLVLDLTLKCAYGPGWPQALGPHGKGKVARFVSLPTQLKHREDDSPEPTEIK